MARKLFTLAAAASLVLCLFTAWLWRAGRIVEHRWVWSGTRGNLTIGGSRGLMLFWLATPVSPPRLPPGREDGFRHEMRDPPTNQYEEVSLWLRPGWRRGPFWFRDTDPGPAGFIRYRYALVPAWSVVGALLVLPVARLLMWGLRLQRTRGRFVCALCEYDLRGNVSGVCPECGTPIAPVGARDAGG